MLLWFPKQWVIYLLLFITLLLFLYSFPDVLSSVKSKSESTLKAFQFTQSPTPPKTFNGRIDFKNHSVFFTLAANQAKSLNDLEFDLSDTFFKPLNQTPPEPSPIQLNDEMIYVYYAYLEKRDPAGLRIRILGNGNCDKTRKEDITVHIGNGIILPIEMIRYVNGNRCEKRSFIDCKLREVEYITVTHAGPFPDEIIMMRKLSHAKVKLYKPSTNYLNDVSSCIIVPLFWYNDWLRLFISFEFWRRNKIHKILIHVHSVSRTVRVLLDHYIKEGLVEIRPLPMMPTSKEFDPNGHILYVSHQISMAICPTWSQTRYTTMNDVDELFYSRDRNKSFKEEIHRLMHDDNRNNVGLLELKHNALGFDKPDFPNIWESVEGDRLNFLKSAKPFEFFRPPKYIYETRYAKYPGIHLMFEFYAGKTVRELNNEKLVYLHMRDSFADSKKEQRILPDFQMFSNQEISEMKVKLEKIFGKSRPPYWTLVATKRLLDCMGRSVTNLPGEQCAVVTGTFCMKALKDDDDWLIAIPSEHSKYTVL